MIWDRCDLAYLTNTYSASRRPVRSAACTVPPMPSNVRVLASKERGCSVPVEPWRWKRLSRLSPIRIFIPMPVK
jgi:hypothetical protein